MLTNAERRTVEDFAEVLNKYLGRAESKIFYKSDKASFAAFRMQLRGLAVVSKGFSKYSKELAAIFATLTRNMIQKPVEVPPQETRKREKVDGDQTHSCLS